MLILQTKLIFKQNNILQRLFLKHNLPGLSSTLMDSTLFSSSKNKHNSTVLKNCLVFFKPEELR